VCGIYSYQSTLSQLFSDRESLLAAAMMPIMPVLQTNLDGKSKLHKDAALTELFLMNDIHYMVEYVRWSAFCYIKIAILHHLWHH
jgi:exocyst complex protein 7